MTLQINVGQFAPGLAAGLSANDASYSQFRRPPLSCSSSLSDSGAPTLELAPEPRIFTLKLTPEPPIFHFDHGTYMYLPKFGWVPPSGASLIVQCKMVGNGSNACLQELVGVLKWEISSLPPEIRTSIWKMQIMKLLKPWQ